MLFKILDSENYLREVFDGKLEKLLKIFEQKPNLSSLVCAAREKINFMRRKYLNENAGPSTKMIKNSNKKMEDDLNSIVKLKFEHKKAKIMKKMADRKSIFMVGLDKASDKLIQTISKADDDIQCPISQEKLTNNKLYYMLCQMHHFNVSSFNVDQPIGPGIYFEFTSQRFSYQSQQR